MESLPFEKEYLECGGVICPYCKSTDITTITNLDFDEGGGTQEVGCNTCGSSWEDYFKLTGVEGLNDNRNRI